MKELIIGITVVLAFHVGNIEAAQWMPLGEAEDRQLLRTNNSPEEGRIICTSKTRGNGQGIGKGGRRLGFLTKKGCKTIGGGDKVRWFTRENGDIMVLVDDEPAVQDDAQEEGEDYQAMYEEAWDAAAEAVQQLQDAQERHDAALQGQIDAALVGMVAESEVDRRVEAALEGMVDENTIQVHVNAALVGMVAEPDVQAKIDEALVGMVNEEGVQGQIDAALVGMVSEHDVTPLNCSEGTAVNDAGDACEPTAEYRAAAVEEGRLSVIWPDSILGEEAGWRQGHDRYTFIRGEGMPSHIIAYGGAYGAKILMKNDDGGWEEDRSNPYGPFNWPKVMVRHLPNGNHFNVQIDWTLW